MTIDKTLSNQSNQPKVAANQSQGQQQITDVQTRTIDQIRKQGLDPSVIQKIHEDKAEMDRLEKENAERIKGNYISFKEDKETKTYCSQVSIRKSTYLPKTLPQKRSLMASL